MMTAHPCSLMSSNNTCKGCLSFKLTNCLKPLDLL